MALCVEKQIELCRLIPATAACPAVLDPIPLFSAFRIVKPIQRSYQIPGDPADPLKGHVLAHDRLFLHCRHFLFLLTGMIRFLPA